MNFALRPSSGFSTLSSDSMYVGIVLVFLGLQGAPWPSRGRSDLAAIYLSGLGVLVLNDVHNPCQDWSNNLLA